MGKSTLISRISAARPKIADYPFTTLQPNLGVVMVGKPPAEKSFVVADIPGLIEGAHSGGAGLGTQFLRHIERTRLLVHMVDVSDGSGRPDPVKDVEVITGELASFGAKLEEKPVIMVASKIDVANKDKLAKLKRYCKKHGLELFPVSAVTGKGNRRVDLCDGGEGGRRRAGCRRLALRRNKDARQAFVLFAVRLRSAVPRAIMLRFGMTIPIRDSNERTTDLPDESIPRTAWSDSGRKSVLGSGS